MTTLSDFQAEALSGGEVDLGCGDPEVVAHRDVRGRHQGADAGEVAGPQRGDGVEDPPILGHDVPRVGDEVVLEPAG